MPYAGATKRMIDTAPDHDVVRFSEMPVTRPWTIQAMWDAALQELVPLLALSPHLDRDAGPLFTYHYLEVVGSGEWPQACDQFARLGTSSAKPYAAAISSRTKCVGEQVNARLKARAEEIARQKKLEEAHDAKVRAAIKRAGANPDTYYFDVADSVLEYGMAEVRGHAVYLGGYDSNFVLLQVLKGGKAIFHAPGWRDEYPFTILVTGIKTADLMRGTPITEIGVSWVKVEGFANYPNAFGGQSQAVRAKAIRGIPHPDTDF
jgi:hypothetical protein